MDKLTNHLLKLSKELQELGCYKLSLLQPEVERVLASEQVKSGELERLLDDLYDAVMWGSGRLEYEKLLRRLEPIDPDAALFYANELKELTSE